MESDLDVVALAYRAVREAGGMDPSARDAAEAVYRERHPEAGPELSYVVGRLIHQASVTGLLWPVRS